MVSMRLPILALALLIVAMASGARAQAAEPAGYPFVEVTLTNDTRWAASGLHVSAAPGRTIGSVTIISELTDCYSTRIIISPAQDGATISWPRACIAPGEYVFVRFGPSCAQCDVDVGAYAWAYDTLGDPNCDGVKNSLDALAILQVVAGVIQNVTCSQNSDVNGDGAGDSADAMVILQYAGGLLPSLPV